MWFDAATGTFLGAILGSFIGVVGGIWGSVAGVSAPKGKHQGLVLKVGRILIVIGAMSLLFGIVALLARQPRHVWYSFIVIGVMLTTILPFVYRNTKKMYTNAELKKMSIDDIK